MNESNKWALIFLAAVFVVWFIQQNQTPSPGPGPGPVPIPAAGFRALITYESEIDNTKHDDVFYAPEIRDYLDARAARGPDGATPEWRFWDQHTDTKNESPLWQAALQRARASHSRT